MAEQAMTHGQELAAEVVAKLREAGEHLGHEVTSQQVELPPSPSSGIEIPEYLRDPYPDNQQGEQ